MWLNIFTALVCLYLGISLLVGLKQVTLGILARLRACLWRIGDVFVRPETKPKEAVPMSRKITGIEFAEDVSDEERDRLTDAVLIAIAADII